MSFRIFAVILIIAVNGFFAAAEVALLSVRQSRLRQMAEEGRTGAQAALNLLSNPGRLLSVTQVGVTLASLGLGWAGEETVYTLLLGVVGPLITPATEPYVHGFAFAASFLIISYFHVVLGEVVPKNLAITKADRLADLVAPVLLLFYRISLPFVVVLEKSTPVDHARIEAAGLVARRRPLGGGVEADRQLESGLGLRAGSAGGHDSPGARPGKRDGA